MVDLTKSQCKNICDLIEFYIFEIIRNDKEIDNIEWLIDVVDAFKKLREVANDVE